MDRITRATQSERLFAGIGAGLLVYLSVAVALCMTKPPFADEGYNAAAGYTLVAHGYIGLPFTTLFGLQRHVYSQPPLYFLNQAAWFGVAGLSVFTARFSNMLWGMLLLLSFYLVLQRIAQAREPALLATGMLSVDYTFLMGTATARGDMMAAALGVSAIAVYLAWREYRLAWAVIGAHTLMTLSGLTHPVGGILWETGLIAVMAIYDGRHLLRLRYLGLAAIPYLAGALAWGLYILQDPADFKIQFLNIALSMNRGGALRSPLDALLREVTGRYWGYYGPSANAPGVGALRLLLPLGYLGGVTCALAVPSLRARPVVRRLVVLFGLYAFVLAMVDGTKQLQYLLHLIIVATALLAVSLWYLRARWFVVAALIILQLGPVLYRVRVNAYAKDYLPTVEVLRPYVESGRMIIADTQFAIPFRFPDNMQTDIHFGYRTPVKPDLIEIDTTVFFGNLPGLAAKDPAEGVYLQRLLIEDYRQVRAIGTYRVYTRR